MKQGSSVEIEEVEDVDSSQNISARKNVNNSTTDRDSKKKGKLGIHAVNDFNDMISFQGNGSIKMSPIYPFYEIVNTNPSGKSGNKGDVHYRCLHGSHKICTITQGMNGNLHCNVLFLPTILLV